MEFSKSGGIGGGWVDKNTIGNGTQVKLVSEATNVEGEYGARIVAKMRVKGQAEPVNVQINKPTANALIDAFGGDSKGWMDKVLTTQVEGSIIGGKRIKILYLIPEGFEVREDENGYVIVGKKGETTERVRSKEEIEEEIDIDAVPF